MTPSRGASRWWYCAIATGAVTALLLAGRPYLDKSHFALVYLLLVLACSAYAGHRTGFTAACASFVLFDWFFVPPYNTLAVAQPADWLVLLTFLIVSVVAAELVRRLQREVMVAHRRGEEIDRLATVTAQNAVFASVSHDLRTPLTTIKALAHELGPTDLRAATIEQEADRLNRLVGNLLDLSRVHAGPAAIRAELNAVDDLIGAALQRTAGTMTGRRIDVDLEHGGTLLVGRFDLAASIRILANLLDNAHRHSPPDAPIVVSAHRRAGVLEIAVRDHGSGVPIDARESIFEPFWRGASANGSAEGAGLGLAIARGLADAQGGSLRYAQADDGGSSFVLHLPAADLPDDWARA